MSTKGGFCGIIDSFFIIEICVSLGPREDCRPRSRDLPGGFGGI